MTQIVPNRVDAFIQRIIAHHLFIQAVNAGKIIFAITNLENSKCR